MALTNPEPAPVQQVEAAVERAVRKLSTLCKQATFDFAMSVGKLIVDEFYGGDMRRWRERGVKDVSFRKLARHPDLPMSASGLYRSVAIYELCVRLGIQRHDHLSTSHLRLVLPLPPAVQARLLVEAQTNCWPVRRLRDEIVARHAGDASGPHPCLSSLGLVPDAVGEVVDLLPSASSLSRPALRNTLRALEACIDGNNNIVGLEEANEPSPESARSIADLVHRLRQACASLERRVAPFVPGAKTEPPPSVRVELLPRSG